MLSERGLLLQAPASSRCIGLRQPILSIASLCESPRREVQSHLSKRQAKLTSRGLPRSLKARADAPHLALTLPALVELSLAIVSSQSTISRRRRAEKSLYGRDLRYRIQPGRSLFLSGCICGPLFVTAMTASRRQC